MSHTESAEVVRSPDPMCGVVRAALQSRGVHAAGVFDRCRVQTRTGDAEGAVVIWDDATLMVVRTGGWPFKASDPTEVPYSDVVGIDQRRPRYLNCFLLAGLVALASMGAAQVLAPSLDLSRAERSMLGLIAGSVLGAMAVFVLQHEKWFVEWRAAYRRAGA